MSASRDKQKRKGQREQGIDLRSPQEVEVEKARKKQARTVVILLIVIAVAGVILLIINSDMFYRNVTALDVDGETFSVTDMNYYYAQAYQYAYYYEYGMYYWDTSTSLKDQTYSEDQSWYDHIYETAVENAQRSAMLHEKAVEAGLTISDEYQGQIDDTIADIEDSYANSGFDSANGFVAYQYGKGMNVKLLRQRLEYDYLGQMYSDQITEELKDSYTDDDLKEHYQENSDSFNYIGYRLYTIPFDEEPEEDESQETADETGETDETEFVSQADAKAQADKIADAATSEEAYVQAIKDTLDAETLESYDDDATVTSTLSSSLSSYDYGQWLQDDSRSEGDVTVIEGTSSYYVLYYLSLDDNSYYRANVRHILIAPEEVEETDEDGEALDEDTIAQLEEEAQEEALKSAQDILDQWESGDATEESFIELVKEYSADYTAPEEGAEDSDDPGMYSNISKHSGYATSFSDWALDQSHETGDTGIVESTYGYHIMYFVGYEDMLYCDYLAQQSKLNEDYDGWLEEVLVDYSYTTSIFEKLVATNK